MRMIVFGVWFALIASLCLPGAMAQEEEEQSRWDDEKSKSSKIVLTRRADSGAYGTSAFSFTSETQQLDKHRNYVDLVFNQCGHLHVNPVIGMESRVADLGEQEDLDVEGPRGDGRVWATKSFPPQQGHVYWQEIKTNGLTMTVKFRVNEISRDEIKIDWEVVEPLEGTPLATGTGVAGTLGSCAGEHPAR